MQRRDLLVAATATAVSGLLSGSGRRIEGEESSHAKSRSIGERISLFTDHLDDSGYSYAEIASMLAPLKISGPDLTVRGGGVVPPEKVADELPKAYTAFRDKGMSIPMLTTNLTSARDPATVLILRTMAKLGIEYFKLGYYHYHELRNWEAEIAASRKDLGGLLELSQKAGLTAGLHNHAGATIGGALWDAWEFLRPLDPASVGFYFDPAHATLEGAKYAWKLNLQRVSSRLKMVAIKDFTWERGAKGWQSHWCPLGQGMVEWTEFFQLLARIPFAGPVSVHIEYDPGGRTRAEKIDNNLAAAERDIAFVRKHLAAVK